MNKIIYTNIDEYIEFLKPIVEKYSNDYLRCLCIYLNLGKYFSFDTNYYFGNSNAKRTIYRSITRSKSCINNCFITKNIICKSLAYICEYVYQSFGYDIITKFEEDPEKIYNFTTSNNLDHVYTSEHVYNVISIHNKRYIIDLQLDLINIHSHSLLQNFGRQNNFIYDTITIKELTQYLLTLEYFSNCNMLTNDILNFKNNVIGTISNLSNNIHYVNTNLIALVDSIGYLEAIYNHKLFFNVLLTKKEFNKLSFSSCFSKHLNKFLHFISYLEKNGTNYIYLFNQDLNIYEKISEDQILLDIKSNTLVIKKGQIHLSNGILTTKNIKKIL